jgi:hypothetical protein
MRLNEQVLTKSLATFVMTGKDKKNMLEICSNWVIPHFVKSLPQKKPIFFKGVGYHFQHFTPIFWLFSHASGTAPTSRPYVAHVPACSRLLSARLAVKNPTYRAGLVGLCVESVLLVLINHVSVGKLLWVNNLWYFIGVSLLLTSLTYCILIVSIIQTCPLIN